MTLPISVIIPSHNMGATLKRAVDSAIEAGASEVLIGDDYSHDNTPAVIEDILRSCTSDLWICASTSDFREGVCSTRNGCIAIADRDFVVCLDADDLLLPGSLDALYNAYEPGVWVYGGWREVHETITLGEEECNDLEISAPPIGMLNRKPLCHATFLFHRDDWRRVGGFDPDFNLGCEDYAFQCALTCAGVRPKRIDTLIYQRTVHVNERTAKARRYYPLLSQVLKDKYPGVFQL